MAKKVIFIMVIISLATAALAEERFGVNVYPGSSYEASTSNKMKEAMKVEIACFRSSDSLAKVIAYYKTQPGFKAVGDLTNEGAMFRKGKIDVTIQDPWMDMTTGKMMKSPLICIVQQK
jgi:hypothetical protein